VIHPIQLRKPRNQARRSVTAGGLFFVGLAAAGVALADAISDAGLTADQVRSALVESVGEGRPALPPSLRRLSAEARAQFVRAAGALALEYYQTDDFRKRYAAWRDQHAPKLNLVTPQEMQERNARAAADYAKAEAEQKDAAANIESQRANLKKAGMNDDQINQLIAQMKQAQERVAAMRASGQMPSGPQLMTEEQRQQENEVRQRSYDAARSDFEREHPANPDALVRRKLEEFLALSATVDFAAKVENGKFLDPADERQSSDWKLCFRAGKPAVEAARDVAQDWLKSL
jgi:hypothetical protein